MVNVFYHCAFVGLLHKIRYEKNLLPFRHKCCLSDAKSFFSNWVFTGKFILERGGGVPLLANPPKYVSGIGFILLSLCRAASFSAVGKCFGLLLVGPVL